MTATGVLQRYKIKATAIFASCLFALASCSYSDEEAIEQCATDFAQNYFNLRYRQALRFCTPESEQWIRFKATNISQDDLDIYNSQTDSATCTIEQTTLEDNFASATIKVCNFLNCDTIGKPATMCEEAIFLIALKKAGKKWMVDIQNPVKQRQ